MAQIINYDPQDNPRLQQIYEILLLAGYFRIRISSLKAFDKVIGGIAWCITSSNFQIQLEYSDEMQIGQKIKVSQHICYALKNMKCPYNLQPFQLQGLDVNNIFPVVQWLIKFVYQTRFQRQKYNREIALIQGKKVANLAISGNKSVIPLREIKRVKINKAVMQTNHHNPIRVYSALLQHSDISSLRMYNKLHNMMLHKKQRRQNKSNQSNRSGQKDTFNSYSNDPNDQNEQQLVQSDFLNIMNPDKQKQDQTQQLQTMTKLNLQQHFIVSGNKISLDKLQQIIQQNKQNYDQLLKQTEEDQGQSMQQNLLKKFKDQTLQYQQQIKVLQSQLSSFQTVIQRNTQQLIKLTQKRAQLKEKVSARQEKYNEIQQYGKQIQQDLKKQAKGSSQKTMQKFVDQKLKLKEKKAQVKKKSKARLQQLQQYRRQVQASIPQIDQEVFHGMLDQAQTKKRIFDEKYKQLTQVNQELAVLQRKAENFTSAAQVAQYHQRFVQLFEAINIFIEEKRSIYGQMQNIEAIQKLVNNYKEFLNNAKQGIQNAKSKGTRKQLTQDFKQVFLGFEKNMNNSKISLNKLEGGLQKTYKDYEDLIKIQREYMKKLRELKIEYEKAQKMYQ